MQINFTKMEGIGNDFVIIDLRRQNLHLLPEHICRIANRRTGVGCDQVLLLDNTKSKEADFSYRVFNSDGTVAENCGNGLRCVSLYLSQKKEIDSRARAEVGSELYFADVLPGNQVRVNMGRPDFEPGNIGLLGLDIRERYEFQFGNEVLKFGAVSMGNPHAVIEVNDFTDIDISVLGKEIQNKAGFKNGVNVGFFKLHNDSTIDLKVWERGVGETPACGSGACAAVAVGAKWGLLSNVVEVRQNGGDLKIEWDPEGHSDLVMIGPANYVFEGTILV